MKTNDSVGAGSRSSLLIAAVAASALSFACHPRPGGGHHHADDAGATSQDAAAADGARDDASAGPGMPDAAPAHDASTSDGSGGHSTMDAGAPPGLIRFEVVTNGHILDGRLTGAYGRMFGMNEVNPTCNTAECQVPGSPSLACNDCFVTDMLPTPTCSDGMCTYLLDRVNAGGFINVQSPGDTFREVTPTADPASSGLFCSSENDINQGPYLSCNMFFSHDPTRLTLIWSQDDPVL